MTDGECVCVCFEWFKMTLWLHHIVLYIYIYTYVDVLNLFQSYVVSIHLVVSPAYLRSNSVPVNVRQETVRICNTCLIYSEFPLFQPPLGTRIVA